MTESAIGGAKPRQSPYQEIQMFVSKSEIGVTYVLPSKSLRDLIIRNRRHLNIHYDYVNTWKDVNGFGLMLAKVPAGPPAPQPRFSNLYRNPGYDLINM